jgi:hypothetical protein
MKATWAMPARVKEEPMSREVETEQEIRLELRARPALIALAAIAQGRRARGGLAAGRGRTSPRAAIGPKGARAVTKLEERLSTPIDGPQEASWQPNQQGNQQLSAKKRPSRRPPKPQSAPQKPPRQRPPRPPQQLQQKRLIAAVDHQGGLNVHARRLVRSMRPLISWTHSGLPGHR